MKHIKLLIALTSVVVMLFPTVTGVTLSAAPSVPSARTFPHMTYDTESKLVVLYGGQTELFTGSNPGVLIFETWTFNPSTKKWTKMSPSVKPYGCCGSMAYDSKADRSILLILSKDTSTLQTWEYNANADAWKRLADGPGKLGGAGIAYDSESDRIIMFGGATVPEWNYVYETWAYDYNTNTWTNMKPLVHPSARNFHGMTYDPKADRVVVLGGQGVAGFSIPTIWTYDYNSNTWKEYANNNGPTGRIFFNLVYDEKADRFITYGGYGMDYLGNNETWIYNLNNNTWQKKQPTINPGKIYSYSMTYATDANRIVLFGGQEGPQENWLLNLNTWIYNLEVNQWTRASMRQENIMSIGSQDGWLLESSEISNAGGTMNATAATLSLGDNAQKKQYRSILSFATGASLPDNSVITKVTLKLKRQGIFGGGNPVTMFQGFMLDMRKGTFGTSALQVADWQANANKTYGPFTPALTGEWYTLNLTSAKAYINKLATGSGLTQIRLRFQLDDNNNAIANYLSLYSGDAGVASRPQLIIEYYVP